MEMPLKEETSIAFVSCTLAWIQPQNSVERFLEKKKSSELLKSQVLCWDFVHACSNRNFRKLIISLPPFVFPPSPAHSQSENRDVDL